jgi:hypothetical protein
MPESTTKVTTQNMEVDNVTQIIVTPPAQDPALGDWARDIRIFGQLVGGGESVMILQLKVRGLSERVLQITAPIQEF